MHIYQLCSHGNLHNTVKNNQQKGRTPPKKILLVFLSIILI